MYSELKLPVLAEVTVRAVEKRAWKNVSRDERGERKFYLKARPGGWREDLSPQQAATAERITVMLLEKFYPKGGASRAW